MEYNLKTFASLGSTQTYMLQDDENNNLPEFSIYLTHCQKEGKGQANNAWESENFKNLTFSLLLKPLFLQPAEQFIITQILSLGVIDCLKKYLKHEDIKIKWPNDIYVKKNKICGILVQNKIMGNDFLKSYCGIGLNVNQTLFKFANNPTSMALETEKNYDLDVICEELIDSIFFRYYSIRAKNQLALNLETIKKEYLSKMLYFGQEREYIYKEEKIKAKIIGVNSYGALQLNKNDGKLVEAEQKEIKFIH
ncbi:MAG: biotin--[acetyl-CoA-carboxylase] ligase [Bacteroidales bacterium]|jgi:BirA family biotin operon repressor/biotin-[acetyl-CoA-carboxylase] ligase|nr:biotin--[acetyl-CoA-carboxylase] ligase [Bacteroidales bacterium]